MTHTPGPWVAVRAMGEDGTAPWYNVEASMPYTLPAEGDRPAYTCTIDAGIALVFSVDGASEANAKLIAAAPLLLGLVLSARAWVCRYAPVDAEGLDALVVAIADVVGPLLEDG